LAESLIRVKAVAAVRKGESAASEKPKYPRRTTRALLGKEAKVILPPLGAPKITRLYIRYTRRQPSWASSSVFAQIPLRSTHGTYRGPILVSVTASLAATAIRARTQALCARALVAHDQQIGWFGAELKELAGAVEERGARGGKLDIAPMGRETGN
jgi:hypothetical protein